MHSQTELLITTFAPFRGREQNGSHTMGKAIEAALQIEVLHLPVHWGSIERVALPRIEALKPRIVLGLGEGEPGVVKFETLAFNQRLGDDERSAPPPSDAIDSLGPEQLPVRWPRPLESIFATPAEGQISQDAGRFLCNNALYCFLQSPTPFAGFLHLPPQESQSDSDYLENYRPLVLQIINNALAVATESPDS